MSHSSLRDSCDIGFRVQFNVEFPRQVMNFPIKISFGLPAYAASVTELNTVQQFLRRCHKRRCISYAIDIYDLLEKSDRSISKKIRCLPTYPLYNLLPRVKTSENSNKPTKLC